MPRDAKAEEFEVEDEDNIAESPIITGDDTKSGNDDLESTSSFNTDTDI